MNVLVLNAGSSSLKFQVIATDETEGAAVDPRLGGGASAGAPLATCAVTVARGRRRLAELEAHAAAETASGE